MKAPGLTNSMALAPTVASPMSRVSGNCDVAPTSTTESCTSTSSPPQGCRAGPAVPAVAQLLGPLHGLVVTTPAVVGDGRVLRVHATGHKTGDACGLSSGCCVSVREEKTSSMAPAASKVSEVSGSGGGTLTLPVLLGLCTVRSAAQHPCRLSLRSQVRATDGEDAAAVAKSRLAAKETHRSTASRGGGGVARLDRPRVFATSPASPRPAARDPVAMRRASVSAALGSCHSSPAVEVGFGCNSCVARKRQRLGQPSLDPRKD